MKPIITTTAVNPDLIEAHDGETNWLKFHHPRTGRLCSVRVTNDPEASRNAILRWLQEVFEEVGAFEPPVEDVRILPLRGLVRELLDVADVPPKVRAIFALRATQLGVKLD